LPSIFNVTGSPVTTSGTLTGTLATQTAGKIFAAPPTSTGTPTFQQIVAEHLNSTYSNGQVLTTNGAGVLSWATAGGSGTVTSVGLSLPTELTVTGSPVTTSGTLTGTWATQTAGKIFSAPATTTGTPTFKQITAEHLNATYTNGYVLSTNGAGVLSWIAPATGTVTSVALSLPTELTVTGSPVTTSGTLTGAWATQTAGKIFSAPATTTGTPTFKQITAEHLNATYTNGYVLTTNGAGVLSWTTVSSSTPGGASTSVQYNNAGSFGGSNNFVWDNTTQQVTITTASTTGGIIISGVSSSTAGILTLTTSRASGNTSAPSLLINNQSDTGVSGSFSAGGQAGNSGGIYYLFRIWSDGHFGTRLLPADKAVNAIVQFPWRTGDTLPTLYVGSASSNQVAIQAVTNTGSAAIIASGSYIGVYTSATNTAGLVAESDTNGNNAAIFRPTADAQSRNYDLVRIDTRGATGTSAYALNVGDISYNAIRFLTVNNETGKTSVRNGLATDNKMVDVGGVYYTSTTNASNTSTTETDLSNATLAANMLGTDGDRIEVEGSFTTVNNGNAKTIKFYFGGFSFTYDASTDAANKLVMKFTVIRTGSSAQKIYGVINETTVSGSVCVSSDTVALTSSVVVKFTGQGGASNDITETTFTIKYYPKGGA
jgi:hypothetical protein